MLCSNECVPLVFGLDTTLQNSHDQKRTHKALKGNEHRGRKNGTVSLLIFIHPFVCFKLKL